MTLRVRVCTLVTLIVSMALTSVAYAAEAAKPKVRAITAFVRIDRERFESQIGDALVVLRKAKSAVEQSGYEVESIRIVTQPFPEYTRGLSKSDALEFLRRLVALKAKESFDLNIGPAMLRDSDDAAAADLLAEALSTTKLNASLIIAGQDGIHWKSLRAAAKLIKTVAEHSPQSQGNFGFAATAMLDPYAPFYPGAYHTGEGRRFAVALESANVVEQAFTGASDTEAASQRLIAALTPHLRTVEAVAKRIEKETRWTYMGIDPTPAPLSDVSIGRAIETLTGQKFGSSGTLTAAAAITRAIQAIPVKQVGYSGLMVPVMEDSLLAQRWAEGTYNIDSVLAYSAVCGTGLDTIPLPGDISEQQIEKILADVASLAVKWRKPLTARLLPVAGKKAGDRTEFDDPFLVNTTIRAIP
ncbi:MAG: DUF711 family protein [Acidobacteriales bacterium]|nr:DUF711 family protein [Terriglobales bacterium]